MQVKEVFKCPKSPLIKAHPEETIAFAANMLTSNEAGAVIVVDDDDELIGILSERDIVRALPAHGAELLEKPISFLMTRDVKTCCPTDPVEGIMKMMADGWIRHIPVVNETGKVDYVISIVDVVKSRVDRLENEAAQMRAFISGHS